MFGRLALIVILGLSLEGCAQFHKKKPEIAKPKKPDPFSVHEASQDPSFQSFLSQLRTAIATKDIPQLASMMTPNFAYYMGNSSAQDRTGEGVFQYWEEKGIWPELQLIIREKFVPNAEYMVAPSQLVFDENYHGYRAGLVRVGGNWKFAYFVTDAPSS